MKKTMIAVFAVLGLIVFSVPVANASKISSLSTWGPYQINLGGEFTLKPDADLSWVLDNYSSNTKNYVENGTLQTFCVETSEHIDKNSTYDVTLNDTSVFTGKVLNLGTAWLYHEFQSGTLLNYDYDDTTSRKSDAALLQDAIWYFMGVGGGTNYYTTLASGEFADPFAANGGTYGVKIMNLWEEGHIGEYDFRVQDQLVCVPDASIMLLLGPALIGMGILGRRRKVNNL